MWADEVTALRVLQPGKHPHVANLLHYFESRNTAFAVLQYCAGGSLRRLMDKGAMAELTVVPLLRQLCDALAFIHSQV